MGRDRGFGARSPMDNDDAMNVRLGTRNPGTISQGIVVVMALMGGPANA
jgi:hypothetical protein